jgi:hypothetical protein
VSQVSHHQFHQRRPFRCCLPFLPRLLLRMTAFINSATDYSTQVTAKWNSFVSNFLASPFNLNYTEIEMRITGIDSTDREPYQFNITCSNWNTTNWIHKVLTSPVNSPTSRFALCESVPLYFRKSTFCWNCAASNSCMNPRIGRISLPGSTTCCDILSNRQNCCKCANLEFNHSVNLCDKYDYPVRRDFDTFLKRYRCCDTTARGLDA